jgi:predicted acetyltransferase
MKLSLPSVQFQESFIEAVGEFQADAELNEPGTRYRELSIPELERDFATYVQKEKSRSLGDNLPEGYVPDTTWWLVDRDEFIGRVSIRHRLTEPLRHIGGHIGYDIRPSHRRQGYGSRILELALPKAKEIGLSRVLLTCDATNLGSRRIIEKNGGELEEAVPNPETGPHPLRFWINV